MAKLDKKRPVYFAMDHTSGKDQTICDTIVGIIRNAGITVVRAKIGPNMLYQNMEYMYNNNIKNAILFNAMNGVDPSNIKEVSLKDSDGHGSAFRKRGNTPVLGWFYDACDPVNPGGRCVKYGIRGSETHHSRMYHPDTYMEEQGIIGLCTSSDEGTRPGDYTGEKLAKAFVALFEDTPSDDTGTGTNTGNTDTDTIDNTTTMTTDSSGLVTTKTLKTKVIQEIYEVPYYEKILNVRTDSNGGFRIAKPTDLKIRGQYDVNYYYAGNTKYNSSNASAKIINFDGDTQEDKLIQRITTDYYSDNTSTTNKWGSDPQTKKTKTVTTTYNYNDQGQAEVTTKTVNNWEVIKASEQTVDNITYSEGTATSTNINSGVSASTGNEKNPFDYSIACNSDGSPAVNGMIANGKKFEMCNNNSTYTATVDQYRAVFQRDSKLMQLKDYYTPKYVALELDDKWVVFPRMKWNVIEQSIYHYMVKHNGTDFPRVTINMSGQSTQCGSETIAWQASEGYYHFVADKQNNDHSCGPTAGSMCTQVLHNYQSEIKLQRISGIKAAPGSIARALQKYGFSTSIFGSNSVQTAKSWLSSRKPVVWHVWNHYLAFMDMNKAQTKFLVGNSAGSTWGPATGWRRTSRFTGSNNYGQKVKVGLNWTITDTENQRLSNYYNSMGGRWERPDNNERIYRVWYKGIFNRGETVGD